MMLFFVGQLIGGNAIGAKPINPMESLFVPETEYAEVERQALDGSAQAALRLERQYGMTAHHSEAIFWASIAADFDFQLSSGKFIESKFGTAKLSSPQRAAAREQGDNLEVQSWNYPTLSGLASSGPAAALGPGK